MRDTCISTLCVADLPDDRHTAAHFKEIILTLDTSTLHR